MNGNDPTLTDDTQPQPVVSEKIQLFAVIFSGLIAAGGMFAFVFCSVWKIYMDPPMLIAVSSIVSNITGALTMVFATRKIAQLNQNSQVKNAPQTQTGEPT